MERQVLCRCVSIFCENSFFGVIEVGLPGSRSGRKCGHGGCTHHGRDHSEPLHVVYGGRWYLMVECGFDGRWYW